MSKWSKVGHTVGVSGIAKACSCWGVDCMDKDLFLVLSCSIEKTFKWTKFWARCEVWECLSGDSTEKRVLGVANRRSWECSPRSTTWGLGLPEAPSLLQSPSISPHNPPPHTHTHSCVLQRRGGVSGLHGQSCSQREGKDVNVSLFIWLRHDLMQTLDRLNWMNPGHTPSFCFSRPGWDLLLPPLFEEPHPKAGLSYHTYYPALWFLHSQIICPSLRVQIGFYYLCIFSS